MLATTEVLTRERAVHRERESISCGGQRKSQERTDAWNHSMIAGSMLPPSTFVNYGYPLRDFSRE